LHRFTVFVTLMTLLLVVAGALTTSNDAGGAIPDWPLSWGRLVPPLEGGIVYAYTHRVLAAVVVVLSFAMGWKGISWLHFGLVVAQALVGAAVVLIVVPKASVLVHACLAQLTFGAVVYSWSRLKPGSPAAARAYPQLAAAAAIFVQTILGAALRHQLIPGGAHIAGAVVTTLIVLWAVVPTMMEHMREAGALLAITALQIFLGFGAWVSRTLDAPQPMPMMVGFTAAHVAVGSMAFGAAIVLALAVSERRSSERLTGGMAVA
jgi:cytochrome c oxidase assembly protein subunit 15